MPNYSSYLEVCRDAVRDEQVFNNFKHLSPYRSILEHVTEEQGLEYLKEIKKHKFLLERINKFITNDNVGAPMTYYYDELKCAVSPTTLRYIKVLSDLMHLFGTLDDLDIVEIGGGYGGQCKIIYDVASPNSYTIVDLPEVMELQQKYLYINGIDKIQFGIPSWMFHYDLCISNYAFTEVDREYQDLYKEKIIAISKRGYITCNFLDQRLDGSMTKVEILSMQKNSTVFPEVPLTGRDNLIYTWDIAAK